MSHLRQKIDTVLIEKMLPFKLPASAFQQARREALPRSVLLGHTAIFGHKQNSSLQDIPRANCPCGEGDGRKKPTSQLHTCLEGKVIEEIRDFLEWGGGSLGGDHQVGCCEFGGRRFDTHGCFLLGLPSSRLRGCCGFGLRLLRSGRLPGDGHYGLLVCHRDRLRRDLD
jgi:hypothetical protein